MNENKGEKYSFKKQLVMGGLIGFIAGSWPALWWVAFISSLEDRWFFIGLKIPEGLPLKSLLATADRMSCYSAGIYHIPLLAYPVKLLAVMAGAGLIAGLLVVCLNRLIKFDPEWLSLKALKWTFRSCFKRWQNALIVFGSIPVLSLLVWFGDSLSGYTSWLYLVVMAFAVAFVFLMPFMIIRREVVSTDIAGAWWRKNPRPGWKIILAVVCLVSAGYLFNTMIGLLFPRALYAMIIKEMLGVVVSFILGPAVVCTLLTRDLRMLKQGRFLRWRIIGPYISQSIPGLLFASLIAGPAVSICLMVWKIFPTLAGIYQGCGIRLPLVWRFSIHLFQIWGRWGLIIVLSPAVFLVSLYLARLVWLAGFSMVVPGTQDV